MYYEALQRTYQARYMNAKVGSKEEKRFLGKYANASARLLEAGKDLLGEETELDRTLATMTPQQREDYLDRIDSAAA